MSVRKGEGRMYGAKDEISGANEGNNTEKNITFTLISHI